MKSGTQIIHIGLNILYKVPSEEMDFFSPSKSPDRLRVHPASYSVVNGFLSGIQQLARQADHLSPLTLRVRMSGTIPLLPLHAFTAWTGKLHPFYYEHGDDEKF
jgi:hypothetical protein